MEMLLLAMVLGWVVKNGVKDLVHTGASAICAVQGKPAPAWGSKRRMSRPNGAATRYFSQLWNDSWEDALARHNARNARRDVAGPADSGTATRSFLGGNFRGGLRFAHRKWHAAWIRLKILRNLKKKDRPRPGQETVLGEVVPNAEDGDEDRPQDGDGDEPHVVPTEDGRTDLQFGDDPTDPTGTKTCPECKGGIVLVDGELCSSCKFRQKRRDEHWDAQQMRDDIDHYSTETIGDLNRRAEQYYQDHPEERPLPDSTQEGPTMTTTTEVFSLDTALTWCDQSAQQYRAEIAAADSTGAYCTQVAKSYQAQAVSTEASKAGMVGGGVTGPAIARLTEAQDKAEAAAMAMERAAADFATASELAMGAASDMDAVAAELRGHLGVQEQYSANPGAGTREFVQAQ